LVLSKDKVAHCSEITNLK